MEPQSITELRAQRLAFLHKVYELARGTSNNVHQRDIAASVGYEEELAEQNMLDAVERTAHDDEADKARSGGH